MICSFWYQKDIYICNSLRENCYEPSISNSVGNVFPVLNTKKGAGGLPFFVQQSNDNLNFRSKGLTGKRFYRQPLGEQLS